MILEKTLKGVSNMKRTLIIETGSGHFEINFDSLRACHYEVQRDGTMAFVVYPIDGGRDVYPNTEDLKIQLIEDKEE